MFKRRRPTSPRATESDHASSKTKKRRVVDYMKVLFDIAKESADWFPPLKAALGGVNALIQHYEQFEDVREKVQALIPQLDRFKQNIKTTTIDGDPEETNRREGLASTFKRVEEESQKLLAKGPIVRFADKGEDSKQVTTLIERLREAIVCYQISQQQAIYNRINHLTSSFDTLLKFREKPPEVRVKLESVVAQLDRLKDSPWKELRHERWTRLIDDLKPINDKAIGLYQCIMTERYVEDEQDVVAVSGLVEDIRNVLQEYWMAQQQAIYDQNCRLIDAADLLVMNTCHRARGAEFRHGNRRGCLKGTRDTVLNEIESWAKDFSQSPVFWLNGLAGTGKSTIAQTVSERLFAEDRLGASFCCSRDFEDRSDLHFVFPTIAFQLAYRYPDFRSHLVSLLLSNPDIAHESLYRQMQNLIVEPLREMGVSTVIVIDALDECKDDEPASALLSVLGQFVEQIPRIKFFITGRPEPRIQTGFRLPLLVDWTDVFTLHEVHPSLVNSDIRLFLKHELYELAQRRRLVGWPVEEHIGLLCRRAAGLFVYAVATMKFLNSNTHLPEDRLGVILKLPESTAPEGKTRLNPKTTLDSLYTSILEAAFGEEDPDVDSNIRTTIGAIVLVATPLQPQAIAELVGLDPNEVILFLTLIQSLLTMGEDFSQPIKPFHKSFPDFITDPLRCTNPRFCVSSKAFHLRLATNCFRLMGRGLREDLLSLPRYTLNSEVEDLQERIDARLSIALQYACRSWHNHLVEARGDIVADLNFFLDKQFLAWLEVLSVLGNVGTAAVALERLMHWLQVFNYDFLLDATRDYFYFVTKFFEPISISATHIYHSALELCPTSSVVRRHYYHRCHGTTRSPRVITGVPHSWEPTLSISNEHHSYRFSTWSPCGRFVTALAGNTVEIRNQLTFELLTILRPAKTTSRLTGPLAHSPDGFSLACASENAIIIWDIQTGGVAKEIECYANHTSMVWSLDGKTIGTTSDCQNPARVHVYDVTSGMLLVTEGLQSEGNPPLWANATSFWTVTVMPHKEAVTINIIEIGPSLFKARPFRLESSTKGFRPSSFSSTTSHISILADDALYIIDGDSSKPLLRVQGRFFIDSFSSDGSLFAASQERSIQIWKHFSDDYEPWKRVWCQDIVNFSFQFSPTLTSIMGHSGNILRTWLLNDLPSTPQTRRQRYTGLSRSGSYIATAYNSESTVTIITPGSKTPSQEIDAGMTIEGLALTGNILVVVGSEKVVAWLLSEERLIDGVSGTASEHDSIWSILLLQGRSDLLSFSVEGPIGVIKSDEDALVYDTETGKVLSHRVPQSPSRRWYRFSHALCGRDYLHFHELSQCSTDPEGGWQTSQNTLREGWIRDSEGGYRMWIPVEWRTSWDHADWCPDVATQFSNVGGEPVIIKF